MGSDIFALLWRDHQSTSSQLSRRAALYRGRFLDPAVDAKQMGCLAAGEANQGGLQVRLRQKPGQTH